MCSTARLSCEFAFDLKARRSDWSFPFFENETSLRPRKVELFARPSQKQSGRGVVWERDYMQWVYSENQVKLGNSGHFEKRLSMLMTKVWQLFLLEIDVFSIL